VNGANGSAYLAPPPETADVETSSEDYARRFAGPVGAWFLRVQAETTLELLRSWPQACVLDVGGGHGQLTGPLVEAGYEVMVYGSSEDCRGRVSGWVDAGRAGFRSGDLLNTPFGDHAFDVVVSYRLLPHVRRWPELIGELARLARQAVVVDYPTKASVNAVSELAFGLKKSIEKNTRPFTVFRDREIESAFCRHGLKVTARRPQFFWPMALHRGLASAGLSRALEKLAGGLGLTSRLGSPVIARLEREQ
jgi:2-polyprenyl-3-methyl-5-hydroxy-6-metoxy-1,4-benzoquinol methylase